MQIYRKPVFISILVIFVFIGCDINTLPTKKAKILIGGGPGSEFCLFEIGSDYTITVTSCEIKSRNIRKGDFINEVLEKKGIRLSSTNKKQILDSLDAVLKNKSNESDITQVEDATEVRALVGDKLYWSIYTTNVDSSFYTQEYYNKDLLNLTYKLIELSPIKVGGEYNPIRLPQCTDVIYD